MTDRLILGAHDGTHVLRMSLHGFDVKDTNLKPEQLSFDSRWQEIGNIVVSGTFQLSGGSNAARTKEIPYSNPGFNHTPIFILAMSGENNDLTRWYDVRYSDTQNFRVSVEFWEDKISIWKTDSGWIGPSERTFRYWIGRNIYG